MLRMSAADALAAFESQATNGIPALTNALADPDPEGSERAKAALHEIAPRHIYERSGAAPLD